jgi:hypothetical protein
MGNNRMAGSPAGLVRLGSLGGKVILTTSAATANSGPTCLEANSWTNWTISLAGTFSGYSVTIYGTNDQATANGTAQNWFPLAAPADQSGTGTVVNPLTSITQQLYYGKPLRAVMAIAIGTAQTGTVSVEVQASP